MNLNFRSDGSVDQSESIKKRKRYGAMEKKCVCKFCGRRYRTEDRMNKHIFEHGNSVMIFEFEPFSPKKTSFFYHTGPDGNLVHKCDCCFIYFESEQERNEHREAEHKEKLTCFSCVRTFGNLRCLQAHNRTHHKGEKKEVTCHKCGECARHP